jgi:pilus assembly protein CpaB
MTRPTSHRRFLRDFARAVSWHRRKLAVVAAVAAVVTGISAASPPDPPSVEVVRATHRLDNGSVLEAADLRLGRLPRQAVPDEALTRVSDLVGRTLSGTVTNGQVLTAPDVVSRATTAPGMVIAPLRLTDAGVVSLLATGQRVDIVAADSESGKASVVAADVVIAALPRGEPDGGLGADSGALVLVQVDRTTATRLAQANSTRSLSVLLR